MERKLSKNAIKNEGKWESLLGAELERKPLNKTKYGKTCGKWAQHEAKTTVNASQMYGNDYKSMHSDVKKSSQLMQVWFLANPRKSEGIPRKPIQMELKLGNPRQAEGTPTNTHESVE